MGCASSKSKYADPIKTLNPEDNFILPNYITDTKAEAIKNQLREAIEQDDAVVVGEMLSNEVIKPNEILNSMKQTSLHIAALNNSQACMEALIVSMQAEGNNDLNEIIQFLDFPGNSCIHYCIAQNSGDALGSLLKLVPEISLEEKNKEGTTVLGLSKQTSNCISILNNYLIDEKKLQEDDAGSLILRESQKIKQNINFRPMTKVMTWTARMNMYEGIPVKSQTYEILEKCEKENQHFIHSTEENSLGQDIGLKAAKQIFDCDPSDITLFPFTPKFPVAPKNDTIKLPIIYSLFAAIADSPHLINRIFVNKYRNPYGAYGLYGYKDGHRIEYVLDDQFPTNDNHKYILPQQNEIWLLLLEKLWARINNSYKALQDNDLEQIMKAILGAPVEKMTIQTLEDEFLWKLLLESSEMNVLLLAAPKEVGLSELPSHCGFMLMKAVEIPDGRKIIKLKNKFCKKKYQGAYHEDMKEWGQDLRELLNCQDDDGEEGVVYMNLEEFSQIFSKLYLALTYPNWQFQSYQVTSKKKNAEYFLLKSEAPGDIYLRLHQKKENNLYSPVHFMMCKISEDRKLYPYGEGELAQVEGAEVVSVRDQPKFHLEAGTYIIRAKVEWKHQNQSSFTLSCYSEMPVILEKQPREDHKIFMDEYFKAKFNGEHSQNGLSWSEGWIHNYKFITFQNTREDRHFNAVIRGLIRENVKLGKPFRSNENEFSISLGPNGSASVYVKKKNPKVNAEFQWEIQERD